MSLDGFGVEAIHLAVLFDSSDSVIALSAKSRNLDRHGKMIRQWMLHLQQLRETSQVPSILQS